MNIIAQKAHFTHCFAYSLGKRSLHTTRTSQFKYNTGVIDEIIQICQIFIFSLDELRIELSKWWYGDLTMILYS